MHNDHDDYSTDNDNHNASNINSIMTKITSSEQRMHT